MQLPRVDGVEHKQLASGLIRTSLVRNQPGNNLCPFTRYGSPR
jgi:hypothetical protein